jgi:hypothetical protein
MIVGRKMPEDMALKNRTCEDTKTVLTDPDRFCVKSSIERPIFFNNR